MPDGNFTSVKNFVIVGFPGLHPNYYGLVSAVMFLVYVCILLGNGTFLLLFAREKKLHKPMYYILLNLVVCDVLFSTTTLPKIITRYWFNDGYISFTGCFIQMYFVHVCGSGIGMILGLMAFDRYVAICNPLRYATIFKDSNILILSIVAWTIPQSCPLLLATRAYPLPYCAANTIIHCYCDHMSITKLACTDRTPYAFPGFVLLMFLLGTPFCFILFSYTSIIIAVLRISTSQERRKAFSTCSSQLIIIALSFLPRCFNFMSPYIGISFNPDIQILIILLYSYVPPMINPLIYCLRTKEVREALLKSLEKSTIHFKRKNAEVSAICN